MQDANAEFFFELCIELESPELLADQLAHLMERAIVTAQVPQDSRVATTARQ